MLGAAGTGIGVAATTVVLAALVFAPRLVPPQPRPAQRRELAVSPAKAACHIACATWGPSISQCAPLGPCIFLMNLLASRL